MTGIRVAPVSRFLLHRIPFLWEAAVRLLLSLRTHHQIQAAVVDAFGPGQHQAECFEVITNSAIQAERKCVLARLLSAKFQGLFEKSIWHKIGMDWSFFAAGPSESSIGAAHWHLFAICPD